MRQTDNRSRAASNELLGRLAPLAKALILPKSRVNNETTQLVSLKSITRKTNAVVFSLGINSFYRNDPFRTSDNLADSKDLQWRIGKFFLDRICLIGSHHQHKANPHIENAMHF